MRVERIERRLTVVLRPPGEVTPADNIVEDEPNDRPGHVVHRSRGRNGTSAAEDDGEIEIFDQRVGPLEVDEVCDQRASSPDQEEEYKSAVQRYEQSCERRRRMTY